MKRVPAFILEGCTIERGIGLDKLVNANVREAEIFPSSPFESQFSSFIDALSREKVEGYIFFSKEDAQQVIETALAPIVSRITEELALIEKIRAQIA